MISVYILTFKETNERHYFTSLVALFHAFDYEVLKIKYVSLGKHSFKRGAFENKRIRIEKIHALNKADIDKNRKEDN